MYACFLFIHETHHDNLYYLATILEFSVQRLHISLSYCVQVHYLTKSNILKLKFKTRNIIIKLIIPLTVAATLLLSMLIFLLRHSFI